MDLAFYIGFGLIIIFAIWMIIWIIRDKKKDDEMKDLL
jgi:hypothetical protein